jgi:hypothetical protein
MKHVTVQQALQYVADNPRLATDEVTQVPVWELVSRSLYEVANNPDTNARGSFARANKARKMIMDRLVGKRRAGSHPATRQEVPIEFHDLTTGGALEQ